MSKAEFNPLAQAQKDAVQVGTPELTSDEVRYGEWVGDGNVDPQAAAEFAEYLESRPEISNKKFAKLQKARNTVKHDNITIIEQVPDKPWATRLKVNTDEKGNVVTVGTKGGYKAEKLIAKYGKKFDSEISNPSDVDEYDSMSDQELTAAYDSAVANEGSDKGNTRAEALAEMIEAKNSRQKVYEATYNSMGMPAVAKEIAKAESEGDSELADKLLDTLLEKIGTEAENSSLTDEQQDRLLDRLLSVKDKELAKLTKDEGALDAEEVRDEVADALAAEPAEEAPSSKLDSGFEAVAQEHPPVEAFDKMIQRAENLIASGVDKDTVLKSLFANLGKIVDQGVYDSVRAHEAANPDQAPITDAEIQAMKDAKLAEVREHFGIEAEAGERTQPLAKEDAPQTPEADDTDKGIYFDQFNALQVEGDLYGSFRNMMKEAAKLIADGGHSATEVIDSLFEAADSNINQMIDDEFNAQKGRLPTDEEREANKERMLASIREQLAGASKEKPATEEETPVDKPVDNAPKADDEPDVEAPAEEDEPAAEAADEPAEEASLSDRDKRAQERARIAENQKARTEARAPRPKSKIRAFIGRVAGGAVDALALSGPGAAPHIEAKNNASGRPVATEATSTTEAQQPAVPVAPEQTPGTSTTRRQKVAQALRLAKPEQAPLSPEQQQQRDGLLADRAAINTRIEQIEADRAVLDSRRDPTNPYAHIDTPEYQANRAAYFAAKREADQLTDKLS
jgi:hypothetical protein